MLAAKAIQDHALYNGQEASTRYLDFKKQSMVSFFGGDCHVQHDLMNLYSLIIKEMNGVLKTRYPRMESQSETVYEKAISARAFDIARGFIPAGVTTFVSWHTNLRQAADHLKRLRHHPLDEVKAIAKHITEHLQEKYSSSFVSKIYPMEEDYLERSARCSYFDIKPNPDFCFVSNLRLPKKQYQDMLLFRPAKSELHPRFREFGDMTFQFPLDYGSYRDLQRHRSAIQPMPLLSTRHGFEPWYLEQLSPKLRTEASLLLDDVICKIRCSGATDVEKQYLVPMGFRVPVRLTCSLPSAIYISELRSSSTVHPTLRVIAQRMGQSIESAVPKIMLHYDKSPDAWSFQRGNQDITLRQ